MSRENEPAPTARTVEAEEIDRQRETGGRRGAV